MSLLKWKELAKSKSESGNKINYVHDTITKRNIGQQTSQESLAKVFKPVTSKLDDVIDSNLNLRMPPKKKRPLKRGEVPDYGIDIDDEVEDMGLDDLFDESVLPQQEKQLVPKPPTYQESLQDLLEGKKEFYVDPQYFPHDLPPEYDDDDETDYALDDEDVVRETLDDLDITNYESVDKVLNQPEMTPKKTKSYLNKIIKNAEKERRRFRGYKAYITKQYNSGTISEAERQMKNKQLDNARAVLNEYIKHYQMKKLEANKAVKGSGIKGRGGRQRGGNVMFFNNVKQLLKKLELIIGERLAGNTSIEMRNTGVSILDMLLKTATINKPQYNKLYNQYFKI